MIGAAIGIAASALGGGGGAGGLVGGILGGSSGAGGLLGDVLGGVLGGEDGGLLNKSDPLGLLPSPIELLQNAPTAAEQILGQQSPLDILLGGGPQG